MKNILLLLLFITTVAQSQIVNIPDANFKSILLNADSSNYVAKNLNNTFFKIDANNDGEIQYNEALQVSYLQLYNGNISSILGVEYFTNLVNLQCSNNNISQVDLSSLTNIQTINLSFNDLNQLNTSTLINLISLSCSNNNITNLDLINNNNLLNVNFNSNELQNLNISNLNQLITLSCSNNLLSNINMPTSNNLLSINCSGNLLTNINFSYYVNLNSINCSFNSFTSNDFSNLINLNLLNCGGTSLNSLNLTNLPNLTSLQVFNGLLTQLDVNNSIQLSTLEIYNCDNINQLDISNLINLTTFRITFCENLQSLDMSNNQNLTLVRINSNNALQSVNLKNGSIQDIDGMFFDSSLPNLIYFCADEDEISILQSELNNFYSNNTISVNSYCSFTPGGNYNTITGLSQFDINNNGCDINDFAFQYLGLDVSFNAVSTNSSVYTNSLGNYSLFTNQIGTYELSPNLENPTYFIVNPNPASVNIPVIDNSTTTQNFCITANGVHPDLEIVIAPITPARPGFDAVYKIVYRNKGNTTLSQQYGINFFYDENVLDFVSTTYATSSSGSGSLSWDYANLKPFENRSFYVILNVNGPTETPAVNIGDVLTLTASILPSAGDENTFDNLFQFNQTVVGSYDPNDITCLQGDVVAPLYIGEYLHYVINFENTGTYQAENIVVKTEINPADFDITTLRLLEASHNVITRVKNNIVEFIFQAVNLDTGGHGNILLKIKTKSNLLVSDIVTNKADIYFDYNFPVETNFANTTFQVLSNSIVTIDNSVGISPNPANDYVNIKANSAINSIEIYDVQGRIIHKKITNVDNEVLDVSNLTKGIYFLMIKTEIGQKAEKLIKK